MKDTMVVTIDPKKIDMESITECANIIRQGGTVAFPTETVYGLGGNALNPEAVRKIFQAKGRPSDNPLIVHIANIEEIGPLVKAIPDKAHQLMERFWPGPLTLIFEKSSIIPEEISAGLPTVAIRMPSHPIARKLIERAQVPIAAPSANISGKPSPTKEEHVIHDLMGKVDAIVAGGSCNVGVESTVLDVTGETPTILRPGGVTREMLEEVVGRVLVDPAVENPNVVKSAPKAPGMKYTHYAPRAELMIVEGDAGPMVKKIRDLAVQYEVEGKKVGILCTDESFHQYDEGVVKSMGSRKNLEVIAANLFKALREFDETDVEVILAEAVDRTEIGQAIMNRLSKAAGYRILRAEP